MNLFFDLRALRSRGACADREGDFQSERRTGRFPSALLGLGGAA